MTNLCPNCNTIGMHDEYADKLVREYLDRGDPNELLSLLQYDTHITQPAVLELLAMFLRGEIKNPSHRAPKQNSAKAPDIIPRVIYQVFAGVAFTTACELVGKHKEVNLEGGTIRKRYMKPYLKELNLLHDLQDEKMLFTDPSYHIGKISYYMAAKDGLRMKGNEISKQERHIIQDHWEN